MYLLPKTYRGLPGSVYVLFAGHVVNNLGNFVWPFLTLFLTDKLGLNKAEAGFFVMLSVVAVIPGSLLGGKLADHWGRKRVLVVSRGLAASALAPCAFLGASPAIPWLLSASAAFAGAAGPATNAMVADLTDSRNRQAAYSLLYLGQNVGFVVGPALAGLLYRRYLPWLFLGDALTSLAALVLTAVFVKETLTVGAPEEGQGEGRQVGDLPAGERPEPGGLLVALLRRPRLLCFAALLLVYNVVYHQYTFSLPIQVRELFQADGPRFYGLLMSLAGAVVVLFTTSVTRLTSRFSHTTNIGLGGVLYALGFGMIYLISARHWFYVSTVIWTLGEIAVATHMGAYIADNSPSSHRGRFSSAIQLVAGAGYALGPLLMGKLIEASGVRMVWPVSFVVVLTAAGLMFALGLRKNLPADDGLAAGHGRTPRPAG